MANFSKDDLTGKIDKPELKSAAIVLNKIKKPAVFNGVLASNALIRFDVRVAHVGAVNMIGTVKHIASTSMAGLVSGLAGALTTAKTMFAQLAGILTPAGSIVLLVQRSLEGTVNTVGTIHSQVALSISAILTMAGTIRNTGIKLLLANISSLVGSINTAALLRMTGLVMAAVFDRRSFLAQLSQIQFQNVDKKSES